MFQLNSFSNIHYKGEEDQEVLYLCVLRKKLANY